VTRETALGGSNVRFQPTVSSVVREARDGSPEALGRLIEV